MRIAIGQLWQETNTFNPIPTTRRDFELFGVSRGAEMVEKMARTNELGGFIQSLRAWNEAPEIVGLVRLPAWPSGAATAETFRWLRDEMIGALERALPVDAVLLALHGAMVAQEHPDVEGDILQEVRARIGPDCPLVATLDLHANVTPEMVASTDAFALYHSMPHVDIYETGERGARVLRSILVERARPTTAMVKVPMVVPAERADTETMAGFAVDRKRKLQALERDPRVLAAGIAVVQPWMDIPQLGSAIVVTTRDDPELACTIAQKLAGELWESRGEYLPSLVSIHEAVRLAAEHPDGLTVLSDAADATTSGAPGDSVWILRELLGRSWPRPVLVTVVSPEVTEFANRLGVGAAVETELGGVRDHRFGTRIPFQGTVRNLFDGRFEMTGHIGRHMPIDMGRCAVLQHASGVNVIVTERTGPHFAPELFRAAGFDPFIASVVVAKSPCGFRAVYTRPGVQILSVQAPGCAPSDFWNYPFHNIPRPLWPWDPIETWTP